MTRARENADLPVAMTESGGDVDFSGSVDIANSGSSTPLEIATHISTYEVQFTGSTHANLTANVGANPFYIQNLGAGTMNFQTSATDRLIIDASGRVTMPNQPFAAITIANPPGMTTSGGLHTTGSVQANNGNCWNSTTHRFTAPTAGNYMFIVTGYTTFTPQYGYLSLYRNGANYKTHHFNHNGNQIHTIGTLSMGIPLSANDFLELRQGGAGTGHWQQLYLTVFKAT